MSAFDDLLKEFIKLRKAREELKKSSQDIAAQARRSEAKDFADKIGGVIKKANFPKITAPKPPTPQNSAGIPKITAPKPPTPGNSMGIPKIQTVKTQKSGVFMEPDVVKKMKDVLIRPDVVSKPETFNEDGKSVSRPSSLSGPTPMNVRKAEPLRKPWASQAQAAWGHSPAGKKALGGEAAVHEWDEATKGKHLPKHVEKAQQRVSPEHEEADLSNNLNNDLTLSENPGEQLYHIHEGKMRITNKPMSLKDISEKHGPIQKLEGAGFRVVPHAPKPTQQGTPLRRSK